MNSFMKRQGSTSLSAAKQGDNALGSIRPSVCLSTKQDQEHKNRNQTEQIRIRLLVRQGPGQSTKKTLKDSFSCTSLSQRTFYGRSVPSKHMNHAFPWHNLFKLPIHTDSHTGSLSSCYGQSSNFLWQFYKDSTPDKSDNITK